MTLPFFPNSITASQINAELTRPSTNLVSLEDSSIRSLAGKPGSGAVIGYGDFHGKSVSRVYYIFIIGGGGGGGGGGTLAPGGGGGGGAANMTRGPMPKGAVWSVTIGAGGTAGSSTGYGLSAGTGGTTTFAYSSGGTGASTLNVGSSISISGGAGGRNRTTSNYFSPGAGGNGGDSLGTFGGIAGVAPQGIYMSGQAYGGGGGGGGAGSGSGYSTLSGGGAAGAAGTGPNTGGYGGTGKYLNLYPVTSTFPNTAVSGGGSGGPRSGSNPGGGGWITAANPPVIVLPSAAGGGGGGSMWGNGSAGYRGEVQVWYQSPNITATGGSATNMGNGWIVHTFTSNGAFTAG